MLRQLSLPFVVLVAPVVAACAVTPAPGDEDRLSHDAGGTESAAPTPTQAPETSSRRAPIVTRQRAPHLALPDLVSGEIWDLATYQDPSGQSSPRGFLVAFMASWCQYCTESLPTLVELERDFPDLQIVTVTVDDRPEGQKAELEKVRKAGLAGPVLVADEETVNTWIGTGKSVPRYYFINHDGVVTGQDQGFGEKVEPMMPGQAQRALAD